MMNPLLIWLSAIHLFTITTGQIIRHPIGRFVHDAGNYTLSFDVDKDNNIRLSVEVPGMQPLRLRSFRLSDGFDVFSPDYFYTRNRTIQASTTSITSRWYQPIRRNVPTANIQRGDLTTFGFTDPLDVVYTRFQGRWVPLMFETNTLVPSWVPLKDGTTRQEPAIVLVGVTGSRLIATFTLGTVQISTLDAAGLTANPGQTLTSGSDAGTLPLLCDIVVVVEEGEGGADEAQVLDATTPDPEVGTDVASSSASSTSSSFGIIDEDDDEDDDELQLFMVDININY
ncbi:hypothetical protein FOZ60_014041 [Perkinsus olseni]|uniref:Uncharacterized protein n=1 Tax=Perkinsus olseni TaxID=32597 RepID=A0A7J6N8H3_PEROL|nr:hypothetical protein FOZ60_014041 [Perkinsus olseni]